MGPITGLQISTCIDASAVRDHLVDWLGIYLESAGLKGWVVGVSGGVDSAVVSSLLALTGRPVHLMRLPIHQRAIQDDLGAQHIAALESDHPLVSSSCVDLSGAFDHWKADFESAEVALSALGEANARARIRMTTLYAAAAEHSALVVGTGNRVEDFGVGFYTKYGDGGVDLSPIADLYKSEVFALGATLGVAREILKAAPTDGLWGDDRTDEDQLGASYDELEWAMEQCALNASAENTSAENISGANDPAQGSSGRAAEVMSIFQRLNRANLHKMQPIPICKIPSALRSAMRT
jgi:NAD+ synthase